MTQFTPRTLGPKVNAYYGKGVIRPPTPGVPVTDPSSFGTALWTLLIVSGVVVALGLAAVSDMAMRRREDRAAAGSAPQDGSAADLVTASPRGGPARGGNPSDGGADPR